MAQDFVFISPSVKFAERDLTFTVRNVGVTTLGLAGETTKGPAFEPIFVQDFDQFRLRFGTKSTEKIGSNLKFQLPYVAGSYLQESNQLYVTRILGLSGYDAGEGWAIKASAGLNYSTSGLSVSSSGITTFTNFTFSGSTVPSSTGTTTTIAPTFTKNQSTNQYAGIRTSYTLISLNSLVGSGTTSFNSVVVTGSSYTEYEDMVVALIRSRATYPGGDNTLVFTTTGLTISADAVNDLLGDFTLTAAGSFGTETYTVSLNNSNSNYIGSVLGTKPIDKNTKIYAEAVYPDLIKKLDADGYASGVRSTVNKLITNTFTDYEAQYQTPETPWIVSELKGNKVERLFKCISISDGTSANKEIKISIINVDPINREFDVLIRDFNDTDATISILESFTRCSMNPTVNNYVGNRIGTADGKFTLRSSFVMLELNEDAAPLSIPCGFEGYNFRSYTAANTGTSGATTPAIFYKQTYASTDKVGRTYLGISEKAYDGSNLTGKGINQNMFNYYGTVATEASINKSKGFHLDSGATGTFVEGDITIGEFEVGAGIIRISTDVLNASNPYADKNKRKFTLVPYGGFDGWDEHRTSRTNTDLFKTGGLLEFTGSDYEAYLAGIRTFANPEEVIINVFATPNINWSDNLALVNETIDMIETERLDSIYIMDAPDLASSTTYAEDIVDLLDTTEIDSNYSATYAPWIEVRDDVNGVNVFLPPTLEVVKSIALTDNVAFPWFAPAGLNRGVTSALRARRKLSLAERDTLYAGRINPMATFADSGVSIFGQKTLQSRESALDRINVRRLLLQMRKLIANISVRLLFEQNDQTVRDEFLAKINPVLDNIKRERGLNDFRIKVDEVSPESEDRNRLSASISIKPTNSLEQISVMFTLTPEGASFENV
jgi:hypothetical protein